ncbi:MAG TPA: AMP-binding protein, partial [Actinospica sp.]|nr:AMP-binding protein [Actinospica sp.]
MIDAMLRAVAEADPDGVAVVHEDRRVGRAELYRLVAEAAEGLRDRGVAAGDTVLIALPNCPEFVICYLATARIRALVYAVDHAAALPELRRALDDATPRLVLTGPANCARIGGLLAQTPGLADTVVVVCGAPAAGAVPFAELPRPISGPVPAAPDYPGDWSVTYSSGSVGSPKRICRSQANQVAEARHIAASAGLGTQDRILCVVPLFHALGQFCCMITAIGSGATLVLLEQGTTTAEDGAREAVMPAQIGRILELIRLHRVSVVPAVPYFYELMAQLDPRTACDLSSVRLFLSGANFLPASIAEAFRQRHGVPVRQTYGSSEAGSVAWDCAPQNLVRHGTV